MTDAASTFQAIHVNGPKRTSGAEDFVGALLLEQNDEWQLQRRHLPLEGLQSLTENHTARLSAVVN